MRSRWTTVLRILSAATVAVGLLSTPASAAPGEIDTSFADNGLLSEVRAVNNRLPIVRGEAGRFVLAWSAATQVGVSGYLGSGDPDTGYGTDGSSAITVPNATAVQTDDAIRDGSGRTLVVGYATFPSATRMFVARFTPTGDPDTTFAGDGVAVVGFAHADAYAYGVAVHNGRIYLAGSRDVGSVGQVAVVRLDSTGMLDPAFGGDGRHTYEVNDVAGSDFTAALVPVGGGRFVLAGAADTLHGWNTLVMRIHADGRLDRTFGGDGIRILNLEQGSDDYASDVTKDGTKLVMSVAGDYQEPKALRLRADGTRDTAFSSDGVGRYPMAYFAPISVAVDAHHRVYMVGYNVDLPVVRIRRNGAIASAYGTGGVATNPGAGWGSDVLLQGSLAVASGDTATSIVATRYLSS